MYFNTNLNIILHTELASFLDELVPKIKFVEKMQWKCLDNYKCCQHRQTKLFTIILHY